MTKTERLKLRRVLAFLRKKLPANLPVYLRSRKSKWCGYCTCNDKDFKLVINPRNNYQVCIDTLLHEYAHALSWQMDPGNPHEGHWGVAFSNVYRAYHEYLGQEP